MKISELKGRLTAALARIVPEMDMRDVLVFGGIASAGYGIALIYPPAAWIFCGLSVAWLGLN